MKRSQKQKKKNSSKNQIIINHRLFSKTKIIFILFVIRKRINEQIYLTNQSQTRHDVFEKTYMNSKKIFCLFLCSQIEQFKTCSFSRIKNVRHRDEILLSNRKATTKFAKTRHDVDRMIAIVDRTVSDQKNVRISLNVHDRKRKLSKQL